MGAVPSVRSWLGRSDPVHERDCTAPIGTIARRARVDSAVPALPFSGVAQKLGGVALSRSGSPGGTVDDEPRSGNAMEGERKAPGEIRARISKEIVRLQSEYYGKGPTKARTYIVDDLVVVVLEESFTRAEKTLAERGEREAIQHIRRRFQQQMADSFISIVEQATGRRVRAFLSETDIGQDVSVETFLLADERTDMTAFEDT
jgi:uncharacterized protein YbcI